MIQSKAECLDNVQILRALAALLVVFGHSIAYVFAQVAKANPSFAQDTGPIPWASGVDLFFVISGFIITYASGAGFGDRRQIAPFISRRIFRIVPLYWLLATLWLPILAASGKAPGTGQLIASYALFPVDAMGDGRIGPFFGLGWTLEYEMFFYLLFALAMSFSRQRALVALVAVLVSLVVLGHWLDSAIPPLYYWTRPVLLEFVAGVVLAELYGRGVRMPVRVAIPIVGVALTWLVAIHVLGMGPENPRPLGWDRVVSWGAPMAMIVYAGVLSREIRSPVVKPAVKLGDASYSLYLVHPFITLVWAKISGAMGLAVAAPFLTICIGTLASVIAAVVLYRVFERPVYQALRGLVESPARASAPAASVAAGE